MAFTPSDIQSIVYNPIRMQKEVLDLISRGTDSGITITNATNPFMFLVESAAILASASILESNSVMRKKYPILADKEEDIYHHIPTSILDQIFTTPAEANLYFYVNQVDLYNVGYRPDGANYVQTTIPNGTTITVSDIPLTLLNDINVRLYDNGEINVEQQLNSTNQYAYDNIGTLQAVLYHSKDNTPWIKFVTRVKQISVTNVNKTILSSDGFSQVIPITDDYCYSLVSYKNSSTGNSYRSINISLNDEYIDPQSLTAFVKIYNKNILVEIPDVYVTEGLISGNVNVDVYSSKGYLDVPIDRFSTNDFKIVLGNTGSTRSSATIKNIGLICNAASKIQGGRNAKTLDELKNIVINESGVTKNIPVTLKQVEGMLNNNGFRLVNNLDIITAREFIAMKSLPDITDDMKEIIFSNPDVFINTTEIDLSKLSNSSFIYYNNSNYIVLKSNSIFKEDNGKIYPISNEEYESLKTQFTDSKVKLFNNLKETKYYFNPYYYILEIEDEVTNVKIYDLDNPAITNLRIDNKNTEIAPSCNINQYAIEKYTNGYRLYISLSPNVEFSNLKPSSIKLQLRLPLFKGFGNYSYTDGIYLEQLDVYVFYINTDMVIDQDEYLTMSNTVAPEGGLQKLGLNMEWNIYTITSDDSVVDDTKFLQNEIYNPNDEHQVVVTKESIRVELGSRLNHLYYNLYSVYTTKKYKTYEEDQPLKYAYNIYTTDANGYPFSCNRLELNHEITAIIQHPKGATVRDSNNEIVYKFKKGDFILDSNGNPIIDQKSGIVRYLDVLMFEYEYYLADTVEYQNYLVEIQKTLKSYIVDNMTEFNNQLLENTTVYFKPYNSSKKVEILINNSTESMDYLIQPIVTLYVSNNVTYTNTELNNMKANIGTIINSELDNSSISLENIRSNIKSKLGSNILSVKIEGISNQNAEIISMKDTNRRLTIGKALRLDENNSCVVDYDITLQVMNV